MKSPSISKNKGFTLFELLITMAILLVLGGLGLFLGLDFYRTYALSSERNTAISLLQKARELSMANVNESRHGIYVLPDSYIIFQGDSYATRNPAFDEIVTASTLITKTGSGEIIFEPLTGEPVATGSIILDDGARSSTIQIANEGRISW